MEKFELNILGCGSALPTMRHSATSQVLNVREKLFMIDCGEGTPQDLTIYLYHICTVIIVLGL